jgi:predicted nucleic acid-binding protein
MIVDTDVFIWAMRGKIQALEFLDSLDCIYISDVTYMELTQGTRSKKEFRELKKALDYMEVSIIPINTEISKKAVELVENFCHSHSMQLADALIGATAIIYKMPLSTGNIKHFSPIEKLEIEHFNIES